MKQLMDYGRQALHAGHYERAASLYREAVRRAPMRQDLKDFLGIAIEGSLLEQGSRPGDPPASKSKPQPQAQAAPPAARPQPRPAEDRRPALPPPQRPIERWEAPERKPSQPPPEIDTEGEASDPEITPHTEAQPWFENNLQRPAPRAERPEPRFQPRFEPRQDPPPPEARPHGPRPAPRVDPPRFEPRNADLPEPRPLPRSEARYEPEYEAHPAPRPHSRPQPQSRPEPPARPQPRPPAQPRDPWADAPPADYRNPSRPPRPGRDVEGGRYGQDDYPAPPAEYPRPRREHPGEFNGRGVRPPEPAYPARVPRPHLPAPHPAGRAVPGPAPKPRPKPIDFNRRHQRGPLSAILLGAFAGLFLFAAAAGLSWFYFEYSKRNTPSVRRVDSAADLNMAVERATAYSRKGEYSKAIEILLAQPDGAERNKTLAEMYSDQGDQQILHQQPARYEAAIENYKEAIKFDPGNVQYRNNLAEAYYQLALSQSDDRKASANFLDLAQQHVENVLGQDAKNLNALQIQKRVAIQKRDDVLLARTLKRIIEAAPGSPEANKAQAALAELKLN